jgi:hypothetical protein
MAKTYKEIIEQFDDIILDENKTQQQRDDARKQRNNIIMELTLKSYD